MGRFTRPLTVTKIGADTWRVERAFTYFTDLGQAINVPEGFETDFASVPWGFRNLFPKDFKGTQAAVTHDWLYNQRNEYGWKRGVSDGIFLEAMKTLKVNWLQRHSMYRAVRLGGWVYWNKK